MMTNGLKHVVDQLMTTERIPESPMKLGASDAIQATIGTICFVGGATYLWGIGGFLIALGIALQVDYFIDVLGFHISGKTPRSVFNI